jgi:hypothetical protein
MATVTMNVAIARRPRASRILRAVALVGGYLGVVVWLTWPLARSVWSSMPAANLACWFDMYYSAWALAHESRALITAPTHFGDGNIYHPATSALFYGPAALGALPLFAPAFLTTGNPGFAVNVTFLLGLALTGAAMHVVVWRWTGSDLAGVVGASTVAMSQWLIWGFVPSAPHWAPLYGLPLIAFVAARPLTSFRSALWLVPLVVLQCFVDLVYVAPVVLGPLGLVAALRLLRRHTRLAALRLLAVLGLSVLALLPVYLGYVRVQAANPDLAHQTKWKTAESVYPFMMPYHLMHGGRPFLLTPVAMGLIPLGIVAAGWRRRVGAAPPIPGGWAQGALWTIVGGLLSLNPIILVGTRRFTSPIGYAMQWAPSLEAIRVPSRLGIAGLVGLGILSGVAFGEIAALVRTRFRHRGLRLTTSILLAALTVTLIYRAYAANYSTLSGVTLMPATYGVQPLPKIPESFVPVLASSPAPLIEVPLGPDGLAPNAHARAMFHSIAHRHPVLNGYSSYWPAGFAERMIEATRLPAATALGRLVQSTGLGFIWVHTQELNAAERDSWAAPPAPEAGPPGLTLAAREGTQLLYVVTPATASVVSADDFWDLVHLNSTGQRRASMHDASATR